MSKESERTYYGKEIMEKVKEIRQGIELEEHKNNLLDEFIIINYEYIELQERYLEELELNMILPADLVDMNEKQIALKYPLPNKPDTVLTNEDGTVNFTFTIDDSEIMEEELEQERELLVEQINMLYPSYEIENLESIQSAYGNAVTFSFTKQTLTGVMWQYFYIMSYQGKFLLGGFNCDASQKLEWEPVVKEMVKSIKNV